MIKLTDFFARGGVSPTCRTRRLALNLWNYTSWLLMWPSSLLTSVQPKGAEHNRVPDVCTTKWSNLPSRTHLARSHLIPNKLLLVKVLFSIHKDLVLQQGQIMTPATRAGEIILGKIGATSHGAPWMGAKKTLYSSLRHTHTYGP